MRTASRILLACLLAGAALNAGEAAATIVDLAGRSVVPPARIARITCIHSIPSHMVWSLAPAKLASIDTQFKDRLLLIPEDEARRLLALPLTGIYRGGINREDILALRPDLILSLSKDPNLDQEQRDFGAPVMAVSKDSLADYAASFRLVGRLVGEPEAGERIAAHWDATVARVAQAVAPIPAASRPRVYYAQRKVSTTVGAATIMTSIVRTAGGLPYADRLQGALAQPDSESIAVPLEEVLAWDPQVVIAASAAARDEILADPRWRGTAAVRQGRVHAITTLAMPDRIQSLMGLLWMAQILHPDAVHIDLPAEATRFYGLVSRAGAVTAAQLQAGP